MGIDRNNESYLYQQSEHEKKVREQWRRAAAEVVQKNAPQEDLTALLDALGLTE